MCVVRLLTVFRFSAKLNLGLTICFVVCRRRVRTSFLVCMFTNENYSLLIILTLFSFPPYR